MRFSYINHWLYLYDFIRDERGTAMGTLSPVHWLIVILVILLLFGAKRIPELFGSLGKGLSEFKKAQREGAKEDEPESKEKKDINNIDKKS